MATVTTTTQANPLAPANAPHIARDMGSGTFANYMYVIVRTGTDTLTCYRSTDEGGSWTSLAAFTHTGLQEWSSLVIDRSASGHLVYRINTGTADVVYYRRLVLATATPAWTAAVQASATDANGGVAGSRWQGLDLTVHKKDSSTWYIVWVGGYSDGAGRYGTYLASLTLKTGGAVTVSHSQIISGTRYWSWTVSGRYGPSIELEHNGDGISPLSTPNLWVITGRTRPWLIKMAWNGNGWTGPSSVVTLQSTVPAFEYSPGRWDGTRFLALAVNPSDASSVIIYQRNQANTSTTTLTTPVHPAGAITEMTVSYDNSTKDVRVYAVGTSTDVLYFVTYVRATATWGAWATVAATAVLGSGTEWGVRRGGNADNAKYDVVTAHSGAPNTIVHTAQSVSTPPAVSSFDTSGQAYVNGGPANAGAALPLAWTFSDADPGQTQGSYALSRQIGAGALQYYTAAGGTWGGSEVQNSSTTPGVTLATAWGLDADANHQYKVKVWDSAATPAAGYSAALTLVPSAVVNPSITAPTAAQVLTTGRVTVTWTVAQQTGARLVLAQTSPAAVQVYDSGPMMGYTDTSFEIPYDMATATGWTLTLYTYNTEGLESAGQTRSFTVAYVAPPAARSTFTPSATLGTITVTPEVLAPVGAQPAIVGWELWRRATVTPVNVAAGGGFEVDTTGWAGVNGTIDRQTAQFRVGVASARVTPSGSGVVARAESIVANSLTAAEGDRVTVDGWIRPTTANKPAAIQATWRDGAGAFISSDVVTVPAVAGAWQYLEITVAHPGNAATVAEAAAGVGSTPAAGDTAHVDEIRLRMANDDPGVRLATGTGAPAAHADSGPASGADYEYRWVTVGANGVIAPGPWMS